MLLFNAPLLLWHGELGGLAHERVGPVQQKEIEIGRLQFGERGVDHRGHALGVQLGCDQGKQIE